MSTFQPECGWFSFIFIAALGLVALGLLVVTLFEWAAIFYKTAKKFLDRRFSSLVPLEVSLKLSQKHIELHCNGRALTARWGKKSDAE